MVSKKRLNLKLGDLVHDDFVRLAAAKNKRPSTLAREILIDAISNAESIKAEPVRDYDNNELTSINVRLTKQEIAAIDKVAEAYKVSRNKALIIAIRALLLNQQMLLPEDRNALFNDNEELTKIGGNLNQIAKELSAYNRHRLIENEANLEVEVQILQMLTADKSIVNIIKEHTDMVKQYILQREARFKQINKL